MKVAIAKTREMVCDHFGHCDHFDIYTIEADKLLGKETIPCPVHEPCKLPGFLKELGIDTIIAGGMGVRATSQLDALGINAFLGVSGPALNALSRFIQGTLEHGESTCSGSEGHDCSH